MHGPTKTEELLEKAGKGEPGGLTDDEREELRGLLTAWRALQSYGKLGKFLIWLLIALGGAAAAWRELVTSFGLGGSGS